jgi:uncharacterized protein YerC
MSENDNFDLAEIDSKESMARFMIDIMNRAKDLSPLTVENRNPHLAAKAMWMLSQGAPYSKIRQVTGINHETLRRLEWDHQSTLEDKRKQFATRYAMGAMEYTDLLFKKAEMLHDNPDQLAQISPEKLATVVGIMQDKSSMLSGSSSSDVNKKEGLSIEDARSLIEAAAQRIAEKKKNITKLVDAEVVDA